MPCPYMSLSVCVSLCVCGHAQAALQLSPNPQRTPATVPPTHTHTHTFVWPLSVAANRSQAPPKNCATMRDVDVGVGSNVCRNLAGPQGRQARKEKKKKNVT